MLIILVALILVVIFGKILIQGAAFYIAVGIVALLLILSAIGKRLKK